MARYLVAWDAAAVDPSRLKWKTDATAAPTANDDAATGGYGVGSRWIWPAQRRIWEATSVGTGTATWEELPGSLVVDASVSGAHTIDRADGETHDLTLVGDATITLAGGDARPRTDIAVIFRQDGTGGRTPTLPGNVTMVGGTPTWQTDPNAVDIVGFFTVDGGTSWFGFHAQGGGGASALDDLTDVTITAAADGDFLRHNGTAWVDSTLQAADVQAPGHYEVLMAAGISDPPEPLDDGTGTDWLYVWVND